MKTYTGIVVRASHDTHTPNVTIEMNVPLTPASMSRRDNEITLHCGTRIAVEAACLIGRKVQFQAELSERTQCLTNIQLCVRSEFGLRAAAEAGHADGRGGAGGVHVTATRESGVRESQRPLAPGSLTVVR